MMEAKAIASLIEEVASSDRSDFYRSVWGSARSYADLPSVTRAHFLATPLSKRRYKEESSLVKIVHDTKPFLSEWSFSDIAAEEFGVLSARPFVYMTDAYDAIEKSMWCYERGMVPLIGEKDPDIAMYAARAYDIDSVITDAAALMLLIPLLKERRVRAITVLGSAFDTAVLAPFAAWCAEMRLVIALPEIGAIASATYREVLTFRALPGVSLEQHEDGLLITKARMLVTPIIRYQSNLAIDLYDGAQ